MVEKSALYFKYLISLFDKSAVAYFFRLLCMCACDFCKIDASYVHQCDEIRWKIKC